MTESERNRIEALWFEPGTAADAAIAINARRARIRHVSADWVRRRWEQAKAVGRLPPFERPANGFPPGPRDIVKRFAELYGERRAA